MALIFYTNEHLWCRKSVNGEWEIGLTSYAVNMLDRMTYVEFYNQIAGSKIAADSPLVGLESIKIAWEILAPFSGKLLEVNMTLKKNPALLNTAPESDGWLCRFADVILPGKCMTRAEYNAWTTKH